MSDDDKDKEIERLGDLLDSAREEIGELKETITEYRERLAELGDAMDEIYECAKKVI